MATRKTPSSSRKSVRATTAYAEAKKSAADDGKPDVKADAGKPDAGKPDARPDVKADVKADVKPDDGKPDAKPDVKADDGKPDAKPDAKADAGKPDAKADAGTSEARPEAKPAAEDKPAPVVEATPPPAVAARPAPPAGDVTTPEDLDRLPSPAEIPAAAPEAPAPPPGRVPQGDSRSFRRLAGDRVEFALVYRHDLAVVTRIGEVGRQGVWATTSYPSPTAAARAYALECSRLVGEGFRDYR